MLVYFSLIIAVFIYYAFNKATHNTTQINMTTVTPLPAETVNNKESIPLRVLQLSDLHLEHISISPDNLYQLLKKRHIDVIALTGDFLDKPKTIPNLIPYLHVLQKLNPTYGTFAVLGNHDYKLRKNHLEQLKKVLTQNNITLLQNENQLVSVNGCTIQLIGIDDHHSKKDDLVKAFEGVIDENIFRLVLTHDPNIILKMKKYNFDYLLSGHFHGGQICWPKPYHLRKFGKLVKLNLIKGLIQYDGKLFYINEGLGQTGINIRVGSRPEITLHDIHIPANKQNFLERVV